MVPETSLDNTNRSKTPETAINQSDVVTQSNLPQNEFREFEILLENLQRQNTRDIIESSITTYRDLRLY